MSKKSGVTSVIGQFCVVRTVNAGVHMGFVQSQKGSEVTLTDSRRLWKWTEAFTLHEVSQKGVGKDSRISNPVPMILLLDAIEIIPCSESAGKNLQQSRNN